MADATGPDGRMRWKGRFEFVFASFGFTIGLGNLWRFPQRCYSNGGGVFLIPYLMCVVLCTVPTLFLEFSLGQMKSEGCIKVWRFSPLIQGIGWAIWFNLLMSVIYYNVLLTYALHYMLVAFVNIGTSLPWSQCREEDDWSTSQCHSPKLTDLSALSPAETIQVSLQTMNATCVTSVKDKNNVASITALPVDVFNFMFASCKRKFVTPEEEYWTHFVLGVGQSNDVNNLGPVSGRNAMLLLTMWVIVFYCCIRGIRSIAKVVYVTATFPFLLLLILLVRGITLEGYAEGIKFYMRPDWSKLSDLQIWSSGATQAMYSLGIAWGSQLCLASHNKPNNNVFRDAALIGIVNSCISIFGGFVIFAFLGHASKRLNQPVDEVFDHGPGILFISYVQGISQLPAAAFWTFLFFFTVLTFGIDSQFVMFWTLYDSLRDLFPRTFDKRGKWILLAACALIYLLSLPLVTNGGIHLLMLMDRYTSDFSVVLFIIVETVAVGWIYGINRFITDLEQILGKKRRQFWWFWKFTWLVSCPVYAMFIMIASAIGYTKSSYAGVEVTPGGEAIGWLLIATPIVILLTFAGFQVWKRGGVRDALKPAGGGIDDYFEPEPTPYPKHPDIEMNGKRQVNNRDYGYLTPISDSELQISHVNLELNPDNIGQHHPSPCESPGIDHRTSFM